MQYNTYSANNHYAFMQFGNVVHTFVQRSGWSGSCMVCLQSDSFNGAFICETDWLTWCVVDDFLPGYGKPIWDDPYASLSSVFIPKSHVLTSFLAACWLFCRPLSCNLSITWLATSLTSRCSPWLIGRCRIALCDI
jgi:hypothetical protein